MTLSTVINIPLAAGTYAQLEARLRPARDNATDFNTSNPNLVGKSVRVEGTFKGTPFVVTSSVNAKLEMEFDPPLVIDETTKNATGSSNLSLIENNIRRSFHAFEDDDERGEDHHEGHNGNDDGGHD